MNIFRTLILISVIQISGIFTNLSWDSLKLTQISGKVYKHVKHESYSKIAVSKNDLNLITTEDFRSLTGQVCSKELLLKSVTQPEIISNNCGGTPIINAAVNSVPPVKSISGISQIIFNGAVSAELF